VAVPVSTTQPRKPLKGSTMTVAYNNVAPLVDTEAIAEDIRKAVAQGFADALEALSLAPDELEALQKYRNNRAANLRRARAHVAKAVNAGKAL
jgi:hypothetical protein